MNEKLMLILTGIALLRPSWTSSNHLIANYGRDHLSECLAAIAGRYFLGDVVVISPNSAVETFEFNLRTFSFQQHFLTMQTFSASRPKDARKQYTKVVANNFVLFVENVMQMSEYVNFLDENFVWNVQSIFVVTVLSSAVSNDLRMEEVRHVIAQSWRKYLLNILVITSTEYSLQLYTWFPYSASGDCGRNFQSVTFLDEWTLEHSGGFLKNSELFPPKLPDRLNNCEMTASTFTFEPHTFSRVEPFDENSEYFYRKGTEVQLFLAVAEASGYKVHFTDPPPEHPRYGRWGDRLENGTVIGILGDVVNGKADVAFCCIRASVERSSMLDMTSVFIQNSHVWYVPRAKEIPRWKSIFIIFNVKIWLIIFFSCVLSSVVNFILKKRTVGDKYVTLPIFSPWYLLLGVSLCQEPTMLRERFLLAQWLFYCLLMSSSYQSMLVGMLTNPGFEPQITTIEELVDSNLHYGSIASAWRFLPKQDNEVARRLYDGFEGSLSVTSWKQRITGEEDYAFLAPITSSAMLLSSLYAKLGRDKYVELQNGGMVFYNVMYLQRHSPYRERFDLVFSRLTESGIQLKWWADIQMDERVKVLSKAASSGTSDKVVTFTVKHVEGAFGILVTGIIISLVVYLGEILYHKLKCEKNMKKDTRTVS